MVNSCVLDTGKEKERKWDTEQNSDKHENWRGEGNEGAGRQGSSSDTGYLEAVCDDCMPTVRPFQCVMNRKFRAPVGTAVPGTSEVLGASTGLGAAKSSQVIDTNSLSRVEAEKGWKWSFSVEVRAITRDIADELRKVEDNATQDFSMSRLSEEQTVVA